MKDISLDSDLLNLKFTITYLGIKNKIYNFKNEDERFSIKVYHIQEPESLSPKQRDLIRKSGTYIRLNDNDNSLVLSDYFNEVENHKSIVNAVISYMIYGNRYTKDYSNENHQSELIEILNKRELFLPEFEGKSVSEIYEKISSTTTVNKLETTENFIKDRQNQQKIDEKAPPEEFAMEESKLPKIGNLM